MEFFIFWILAFIYTIFYLVKNKPKQKKPYIHKTYRTHNGELVKSYGEKAIADYLAKRGIKYKYEHIYVRRDGGINKPDFYLPDFNVYIEYFGMMNYSKKYNFEMHLKFDTFKKENMKVIKIYKKHITNHTLGYGIRKNFEKLTGENLPNRQLQMSI